MNRSTKYYNYVKRVVRNERGFTLLELIAVIAILGIIAAISFTAFSTQGEKARISAHKTNIVTIEQAAELYQIEKGFKTGSGAVDEDFSYIDKNHNLIKQGYLKEVPKNPWESTNKDQKAFRYIITKDKRGLFFVYLADVQDTGAAIAKIVDVNDDTAVVKTSMEMDIKPVDNEIDLNASDKERYYRGR
ncbi:prepilin-type N-terminal cleavage/methylation domain-containing protein [Bacillus thuringiensis]|uniref:prepilin-type N-terminal cleavage/methylation domain-containing protein n=1 Tax=Bacillus thuringiensis TaxID=1428 RepID=UPI0021D65080|nr:prepilin-type N-terminal cleavage/methylation domain-containing protein [Bacillus thuringiensis]MCU7667083.1 prepilin-type N-terminal cleavage/methylation domain-containing protein [Bacillus thuringiensis]